MPTLRSLHIVLLIAGCAWGARGQAVAPGHSALPEPQHSQTIPLTVPKGTPIQIALDGETRVRRVGQPVQGRVVEPQYAFDRLVIPTGAEALGQITKVGTISAKERTLGIMNGDFTPARKIELEFDELVLPDGKHIPLHTTVTPGSGQIIQLVNSGEKDKKTVKDMAAKKI